MKFLVVCWFPITRKKGRHIISITLYHNVHLKASFHWFHRVAHFKNNPPFESYSTLINHNELVRSVHFSEFCVYIIHQDFYFLSRVLPPCPLWDGGGFISSTQKICINLLLKKHRWKGAFFHQYLWPIFFNLGLGVQPHIQNTFHEQSSSHSTSRQSRCSMLNFWKRVISIIFFYDSRLLISTKFSSRIQYV